MISRGLIIEGGESNLQERLDRFFSNEAWKEMYPSSFVTHLTKRQSDHLPLILCVKGQLQNVNRKKKRKLYRFEEMWLRDEACEEEIGKAWAEGGDLNMKIARTARKLSLWGKNKFGDFAREMREGSLQMAKLMNEAQSEETISKMRAINNRMDELEQREEIYWRQRSRQEWLKWGDKNTSFFHKKAKQRIHRNHIEMITDEAGNVYEDEIQEILTCHFETLFTSGNQNDPSEVVSKLDKVLLSEEVAMLCAPYVGSEVKDALDQMHPTKAPGPDGMSAIFYQSSWATVVSDVVERVLNILNNGAEVESINNTHVVLIPKKKICVTPSDFRPISLCNVIYKIVSKVLANRLKQVLPRLINESQSGFVPGRLITDNILVAHECFHYMRKKHKGKKGYLSLKLDMSKAYDRVEWRFLEATMTKMNFPTGFIKNIMNCVTTSSFAVLVNGQPARRFLPSRGLRQGDPLSPFLFILCSEGLSALLRDAEIKKEIHEVRIGRGVRRLVTCFLLMIACYLLEQRRKRWKKC